MPKRCFTPEKAPKVLGPYSPVVLAGGFAFLSGQLGIDPETGSLVPGGIEQETRRALANISSILAELGLGNEDVVKMTVYLRNMGDFAKMNAVYAQVFTENPPARSAVEISKLLLGAVIEIEATACLHSPA